MISLAHIVGVFPTQSSVLRSTLERDDGLGVRQQGAVRPFGLLSDIPRYPDPGYVVRRNIRVSFYIPLPFGFARSNHTSP